MSIEESATRARQGGKGRRVFAILVISTVAAAVLLWAIFFLWASNNANVDDTRAAPAEAERAAEALDETPVLQQDEPNPATDEPLP